MKKTFLLFYIFASAASASFGQTFPNASFDTWRTSTSASTTVYAPVQWYGLDSLILAEGASFAPLIHFFSPWDGSAQVFQENTIVHSGTSSAKLITLKQDTLGLFPGILTNAKASLNTTAAIAIFTSGTGNPEDAVNFTGGTAVSSRIQTVSAWVQYKPGVDSAGMPAQDTGLLLVEAMSHIAGIDSVIGVGSLKIAPTAGAFVQITDTIIYTDLLDAVDTIRVIFASGGGSAKRLDSSTLYVDDVSMAGVPEAVQNIQSTSDVVKVYPNPANAVLNLDCLQNTGLSCELYSISGQIEIDQQLTQKNVLNISSLSAGLYLYNISDNGGNIIQHGKVTVTR